MSPYSAKRPYRPDESLTHGTRQPHHKAQLPPAMTSTKVDLHLKFPIRKAAYKFFSPIIRPALRAPNVTVRAEEPRRIRLTRLPVRQKTPFHRDVRRGAYRHRASAWPSINQRHVRETHLVPRSRSTVSTRFNVLFLRSTTHTSEPVDKRQTLSLCNCPTMSMNPAAAEDPVLTVATSVTVFIADITTVVQCGLGSTACQRARPASEADKDGQYDQ